MYEDTPVGILRWPVTLVTREQMPDPNSQGIIETPKDAMTVHADVQPIGAQTFFLGMQTDRPITHRIRIRWLDWIDQVHAVIRVTTRADGTSRREVFRVRRVREIGGRKRHVELECQQETRT